MPTAGVDQTHGRRITIEATPEHEEWATSLAEKLDVMLQPPQQPTQPQPAFRLAVSDAGYTVSWRVGDAEEEQRLHLDWCSGRPGADPIVRAVGGASRARAWTVIDATAGLGADAVAMARAGFRVTLIERDPLLFELLNDARDRSLVCATAAMDTFAERINILQGDARTVLASVTPRPDVVYLDPMYPQPQGKGGAKRQGASFLRAWLGEKGEDAALGEEELLAIARRVAQHRVVVKRPLRAPAIAKGVTGALRGSTTRFDLYPVTENS